MPWRSANGPHKVPPTLLLRTSCSDQQHPQYPVSSDASKGAPFLAGIARRDSSIDRALEVFPTLSKYRTKPFQCRSLIPPSSSVYTTQPRSQAITELGRCLWYKRVPSSRHKNADGEMIGSQPLIEDYI